MTRLNVPLVSYSELSLPLPEPDLLWRAKTALQWKSACLQSISGATEMLSLTQCLQAVLNGKIPPSVKSNPGLTMFVLHGIWGLGLELNRAEHVFQNENSSSGTGTILQAQRETLVRALNDLQLECTDFEQQPRENSDNFHLLQRKTLLRYVQLTLHVPHDSIETLAGKYGDREAGKVYPLLDKWSQTREARQGMWYASQVLAAAALFSPVQLGEVYAVILYRTSLALWAYGIINGAKVLREEQSSNIDNPQTSPSNIVWLSDPEESIQMKRWISYGVGHAAIKYPSLSPQERCTQGNGPDREQVKIAMLKNAGAVMEFASDIVSARSLEERPPLVRNIIQLMNDLGCAAKVIGLG
jgi:hypothetical protein